MVIFEHLLNSKYQTVSTERLIQEQLQLCLVKMSKYQKDQGERKVKKGTVYTKMILVKKEQDKYIKE